MQQVPEAEAVLAMWREVERRLRSVPPESQESEALQADVSLLRDEYHRLATPSSEQDRPALSSRPPGTSRSVDNPPAADATLS